jgi:hypothetical protein
MQKDKEYLDLWGKIRYLEHKIDDLEIRMVREMNYLKKSISLIEQEKEQEEMDLLSTVPGENIERPSRPECERKWEL